MASFAPEEERPTPTARERAPETREIGDVAGRVISGIFGGMAKAVEKVFDFLADLIAPPPPPTKDQAERIERAAEEQREQNAAATHDQEKDARLQETLDQIRRNDEQARYDRYTGRRLDHEDEHERDRGGGRERER